MIVEIGGASNDGQNRSTSKVVPSIDEIWYHQDARYASASEAAWRLLSFLMVEHENSVERLEFHLIDLLSVYYKESEHEKVKTLGKNIRSSLQTFSRQKCENAKNISTLTFRSTSLGTKQKGYGTKSKIQIRQ